MLDEQRVRQECEKLGDVWRALSNMTAELKGRGAKIPPDIDTSLRGTKALISLCRSHPKLEDLVPSDIDAHNGFCVACCGADIVARIKCELRNTEDLLVIKATHELGSRFAVEFQEKTKKAWEPVEAAALAVGK